MFLTNEIDSLHKQLLPEIKNLLQSLNDLDFDSSDGIIEELTNKLDSCRETISDDNESILNEFFVLSCYIYLFKSYTDMWLRIVDGQFSTSWGCLQDSLDGLRIVKKFAFTKNSKTIDFLEFQLTQLERLYPYNIFTSIGAFFKRIECNICGRDMDTPECIHLKGELYNGEIAYGIVHEISPDHLSLVENPADKRCVFSYDDNSEQFKPVRFLSELICEKKLVITQFGELKYSKRRVKNEEFKRIGRNELCFCGSGKKFKHCCISKEYIEGTHIDILPNRNNPAEIVSS